MPGLSPAKDQGRGGTSTIGGLPPTAVVLIHDTPCPGTFIAQPSQGGPKGGPNGSLGVGCSTSNCGNTTAAVSVAAGTVCANGAAAVGGFSDEKFYCCPAATQCIAHGQGSNAGATAGRVVPVCLAGSANTVELCRRENDGLLTLIQVRK
jgi:hypothetical protein